MIVATPHSTHADIAVAAAEAGKHVFVEKPLTLTVADAKRVGASGREGGRDRPGRAQPPPTAGEPHGSRR